MVGRAGCALPIIAKVEGDGKGELEARSQLDGRSGLAPRWGNSGRGDPPFPLVMLRAKDPGWFSGYKTVFMRFAALPSWDWRSSRCATLMYMERNLLNPQKNGGWRRLLGVCCLLLVVFAATAELIHSHGSREHDSGRIHPDCSLCVTAHSAVQATVATVVAVVLRPVATWADPEPLFCRRTLDIRLSIRPPPVAPAFA